MMQRQVARTFGSSKVGGRKVQHQRSIATLCTSYAKVAGPMILLLIVLFSVNSYPETKITVPGVKTIDFPSSTKRLGSNHAPVLKRLESSRATYVTERNKDFGDSNSLHEKPLEQYPLVDASLDDEVLTECTIREEYKPSCEFNHHSNTVNRFLTFDRVRSTQGVGSTMSYVAHMLELCILYDLVLVPTSDIKSVFRKTGSFSEWLGILNNNGYFPYEHSSVVKSQAMENVVLPDTIPERFDVLRAAKDKKNVVFHIKKHIKMPELNSGTGVSSGALEKLDQSSLTCSHSRLALRELFWSVPNQRDRCSSFLTRLSKEDRDNIALTIGVHIRRGDILRMSQHRNLPHNFYVATTKALVSAAYKLFDRHKSLADKKIAIIVMSENYNGKLVDEHKEEVHFDVPTEYCVPLGLNCVQITAIEDNIDPLATLDCLATVDMLIGSKSSYSLAAQVLNTNVKVMPAFWHDTEMQDTVTIDVPQDGTTGTMADVLPEKEADEIQKVTEDWWSCSHAGEGNEAVFYHRVEGVMP